jgi:hypothetical protein
VDSLDESQGSWTYPLSTTSLWNQEFGHNDDSTQGSQAPFHPTICGQRQIANVFDKIVEPMFNITPPIQPTACDPNLP